VGVGNGLRQTGYTFQIFLWKRAVIPQTKKLDLPALKTWLCPWCVVEFLSVLCCVHAARHKYSWDARNVFLIFLNLFHCRPQTQAVRTLPTSTAPPALRFTATNKGTPQEGVNHPDIRSTQPCIPPGSLNRVPASAGVRAGMSPLPGGR